MVAERKFRTDINGLRTIAVIAVVLFHFGIPGFSGGFVGVDVFFVISGFLMTGIIIRGLDDNLHNKKFSFFSFYMARARRIIPALFFLSFVILILGWFYLSPDDYNRVSREVDRALLFISNNYYYKNSGYFDTDSHERLMLHSWSLSVEWQFYIIYPVLLLFMSKISRARLPLMIFVVFVFSLFFSVYKSHTDPSYAFYMLPSRAWEMFLGGLVFFTPASMYPKVNRYVLHYLGLVCIAFSVLLYSSDTLWPGIPALLPAIGAALVIFAKKDSFITANNISQHLGELSYSLYLWHWPFVVALLFLGLDESISAILFAITLSLVAAVFSFYCVENPVRKYFTHKKNWIAFLIILLSTAVLLSYAEVVRKKKGFPERISGVAHSVLNAEHARFHEMEKCQEKRLKNGKECVYGKGDIGAIVVGDSHGMSIVNVVVSVLNEKNKSVLDWTASACPMIADIKFVGGKIESCEGFIKKRMSYLNKYPGVPIFISNRYSASLVGGNEKNSSKVPGIYIDKKYSEYSDEYIKDIYKGYFDTVCELSENNPVYIFRPVPELKLHVPRKMGRDLMYRGELSRVSVSVSEYTERNHWANVLIDDLQASCGVSVIDVSSKLCDSQYCYGDIEGMPVYSDDDHLNTRGASLFDADIKRAYSDK